MKGVLGSATSERVCPGSAPHPVLPTPPVAQTTPCREEDPHGEPPAWDDYHQDPPGGRGEAEEGLSSPHILGKGGAWLACPTQGCLQALRGAIPRDSGAVAVPQGGWVSPQAEPQCWSFSYSQAELRGLLLEGASFLLLRVLACQQAVPPGLVFPAINTKGHLCTSSYVSCWPGWGPWDGGVWVRLGVPRWDAGVGG